ncbi:FAD-dependent oxidoreductase [Exiguobacterium aurantiacum]|uniref:Coenzyme A disulfide reductase n=1 Tax=Exiguobacterium aurantiacum TaxID=33987 RepID=A0A377FSD4_9BACL|nr:FAD-dependent oxidoreductase [Exiguobacterium aurantiacum]STO07396.1 Coenzyme A disulfide reductase [Exiguobacterium aurantiacum]
MKLVIIGSVAAGTSVAAKARRNNEDAQITIYDRDYDISYSGCGIPYYVGGEVESRDDLTPRDAAFFKKRYQLDVLTRHNVTAIDKDAQTLTVENLETGETFTDTYDRLVLATGASSIIPPIPGVDSDNVFPIRNIQNAEATRNFVDATNPKHATIIGAGFIGLEMAEQLKLRGVDVTVIERIPQVMPPLDKDMACRVEEHLEKNGIELLLGETVTELVGEGHVERVVTESGKTIDTDLVILSVGVRPNTELAKSIGVTIGETGAIAINERMETNVDNVYAAGDVAESFSLVTGKPIWRPLGSTANKMGRALGDLLTGGDLEHRGILGTGIFKVFGLAVAQTGLSEREARELGYDVEVLHNTKPDKPAYMGGKDLTIKAIGDRATRQLLGVQIVGFEGVDKRIDVFVTAMTFKAKVDDLFHLDLAYAPPFSTTKDPVMYTGMVLANSMDEAARLITPAELQKRIDAGEDMQVIDTRKAAQFEKACVDCAVNVPLGDLRTAAKDMDKDKPTVVYCNGGVTGNAAQNVLRNLGFTDVYNLSGGNKNYQLFKKYGN